MTMYRDEDLHESAVWEASKLRNAVPDPPAAAIEAAISHRNGMSCKTAGIYTFDANGWKRWCADCGAELGEAGWHPDGADVPNWVIGVACTALALLLCAVVVLLAHLGPRGANRPEPGGIVVGVPPTPATYGPPRARPGPLVARSLPVVPSVDVG